MHETVHGAQALFFELLFSFVASGFELFSGSLYGSLVLV
jgi:hypothetical protein